MAHTTEETETIIKNFIISRFLKGDGSSLTNDTALITGGIIDSILTMQLVVFIEENFHFEFSPHEVDKENLDTIKIITGFIQKKLNA
jgi:acyl carrier protein